VVAGYRILKGRRSVVTALSHRAAVVTEARSLLAVP
jgi:hypothetical protein